MFNLQTDPDTGAAQKCVTDTNEHKGREGSCRLLPETLCNIKILSALTSQCSSGFYYHSFQSDAFGNDLTSAHVMTFAAA